MTEYIGDVPLASINSINLTTGESVDEIDLVDKESNIIFTDVNQGEDIEIEFTLAEQIHPEELPIEEQRNDLKTLATQDYVENGIKYKDIEGRISISSVDVSESSDLQTIRQGSLEGKFLPWPQYEPENEINVTKRMLAEVVYEFLLQGQLNLNDVYITADLSQEFLLYSEKTGFGEDFGNHFDYKNPILGRDLTNIGELLYEYVLDSSYVFGFNFGIDFSESQPIAEIYEIGSYGVGGYGNGFYGLYSNEEFYGHGSYGNGLYGGVFETGEFGYAIYGNNNYGE